MPIEINELHIHVEVDASRSGPRSEARAAGAGGAGPMDDDARKAMVAECVEQVLRILENKMER